MVIRQNPRVLTQPDGENIILFNPDNGMLRKSNASGRMIWSMCDGRHSVDDIVRQLTATYEVDPDTARKDVLNMIEALSSAGFVEVVVREGGESSEKALL